MKTELVLADFKSVHYKVVDADILLENEEYKEPKEALKVALLHNGRVIKVTKRLRETLEMEKVK